MPIPLMLPSLDPAFHWTTEAWGHGLRSAPLGRVAQHLFTTRELKLRPPSEQAWAQAVASLGADPARLMRVKQVHGPEVRVLRRGHVGAADAIARPEADAIVSNEPGVVLAVQVADCVPILMADRRSGAAAAVHAGWRGTCAGVAGAAIQVMIREFGTAPQDLTVAFGPSIGVCCYEVGESLLTPFREAGWLEGQLARWFSGAARGLCLDLWTANRDQIQAAGVPADRIALSGLCTLTNLDLFESFRGEGERAGRMAGLIVVP